MNFAGRIPSPSAKSAPRVLGQKPKPGHHSKSPRNLAEQQAKVRGETRREKQERTADAVIVTVKRPRRRDRSRSDEIMVDPIMSLYADLRNRLEVTSDLRYKHCYHFLLALLARAEERNYRGTCREQVGEVTRGLLDQIGEGHGQTVNVNWLWDRTPETVAPRHPRKLLQLLRKFLEIARPPSHKRAGAELELRSIERKFAYVKFPLAPSDKSPQQVNFFDLKRAVNTTIIGTMFGDLATKF